MHVTSLISSTTRLKSLTKLRELDFLGHAFYMRFPSNSACMAQWLAALHLAIFYLLSKLRGRLL